MLRTPKPDEVVAIYETQKNRATGSHTMVLDLRPVGHKYALHCATHRETVLRDVRLAAEAESHQSAEWCPQCNGEHVPPAVARRVEFTRDELRAAYMAVVNNFATTTSEVGKVAFDGDTEKARLALEDLGDLVTSSHINGERALTWQSGFDVENDKNARRKAATAFRKAFPTS